ncbi:AMP-binding protein [Pseudonocardia sp. WMMC193]|uniref:AMP-binding protein n=1 Tax=Pseudonocardia sp. WMMC193 TaxID=2911965 RepID=UPI0035ABEEEE
MSARTVPVDDHGLSYAAGPRAAELDESTVYATLARSAEREADRLALVEHHTGRTWTYTELLAAVDACATGLYAAGVRPGERVGIWSANCAEWVLVQFASAKLGAILVTINPAYRAPELGYALRKVQVSTLVSATGFRDVSYRELLDHVRADCPDLRTVIELSSADWERVAGGAPEHTDIVEDIAASLDPDDPINIQFTSGTTGSPKGATLSHRGIVNNARFFGDGLAYTPEDRVCVPVPLYHCFGMVMGTLSTFYHGATAILAGPWFDPLQTLQAVAQHRCTSLYGVPTMFIAELEILASTGLDVSSLRTGIMGGSPCPVDAMLRVISELGMEEVTICFGMTENSPVATQTKLDDDIRRKTETVGVAMPHLEIAVRDAVTGDIVPRGSVGEACFRGYSVMIGYWEDPERTAEVLGDDGWLSTGDLAVMDEDGYLTVVGRLKDMIIRGGENIYPREIEECLMGHPDVVDVQVVGVPDDRMGEEVAAWLVMRPGSPELNAESVREYCEDRLSRQKIPRYVQVVDQFPMTVTGKVRKNVMREIMTKGLNSGGV